MHWYRPVIRPLAVCVLGLGATLGVAVLATAPVLAQTAPPTANQGPQFPGWGPGRGAPAPSGPSVSAPGPPGAPPPYSVPAPNWWGGCDYDLRGQWRISGTQTRPWDYTYTARIFVQQFANWLQVDQPEDGVTYYGQCQGSTLRLDVYSQGSFIGYENGVVRFQPGGAPHVAARWVTFGPAMGPAPGFAEGRETWWRW